LLGLLLALKPACGGSGGGGNAASSGALSLPGVVPGLPLDTSAATINIDALGQTDAAVQALLQTALNVGGKIVMTHGGTARTIVLTLTLNMPSDVGNPKAVILDGSGDITLSGNSALKILDLQDLAQLTVQRMSFIGARTADSGAAINSVARVRNVTVINCSFDNCKTANAGPDIGGGALRIWNGSHTQISGCTFSNCAGSNGGALNSLGTRLTIINSTFTSNSAFGTGGGADVGGNGGIGGAVYVDNVSNDPNALHQLSITGSTFTSNQANDHAGAVFGYTNPAAPSTSIVDRCTFSSNMAPGGLGKAGGYYSLNGSLTLSNSTFTLNQAAGNGGAMDCSNSSSLIANCTFQGNTATNLGGGISAETGTVSLVNVTLAQNVANNFAGGLFSLAASTEVQNSVLSGNTAVGNPAAGTQVNNSFAGGANVQAPLGSKPASASGTTMVADAMLGPLQINGGTTKTMRPLAASAAIDLVGVTGAPLLDQGGNPRNRTPDAGACEGP
jgi:predicted outer membrane repeat protein